MFTVSALVEETQVLEALVFCTEMADIVLAAKIPAEKSDGLGSKEEENPGRLSDMKKNGDGSVAAICSKQVIENGDSVDSSYDGNSVLSITQTEEIVGQSLTNMSAGRNARFSDGSPDCVEGADDKIEDGEGSGKDNADFKTLDGNVINSSYVDVKGDESRQGNDEKLKGSDNVFRVGDLVWGKIRSHPWWPGQVYDPREASELAARYSQEGRLLVAFFGDGSCSWCLPSQLVPFVENFRQMSMDSSSKTFHNAVQSASDEIGRVVEIKLTCKCFPLERRVDLATQVAANAGVKAGVLMPEVDINRLAIPEREPAEILAQVVNYSKCVSVDNVLEFTVLRSWLSAFSYSRNGYRLPVYCEPVNVEGLEDKDKNTIEVPALRPLDDDWYSSSAVSSAKPQASSDVKIYHRRKQKSVAEIMAENDNVEPKSQKGAMKRKDEVGEGVNHQEGSSGERGRKREAEELEVADTENASDGAKEESENVLTPRQRKKSWYLSPPYTTPIENSSFIMEPESDSSSGIKRAKKKTEASGDPSASRPVSKLVDVPVNELILELQFAALDPLYLSKQDSLDKVWSFVSAFRSSTYLHGPGYKISQKSKTDRKRKSLSSHLGNQENDLALRKPKSMKTVGKTSSTSKSKKAADLSRAKASAKKLQGNASTCLILTFEPGFPLPSKEEIAKLFGKYGSLNEEETQVSSDSHSVKIVYTNEPDAEAAFKSSVSESPFGVENVNYWLHHSLPPRKKMTPENPNVNDDFMSGVGEVRQKLEIITAIYENYHYKISLEDKSSLKDEIQRLVETVETVSDKVRVMAENSNSSS